MKNIPTVSVVIPCFNDGQYLTEALQSVRAQTLQPVEILVINDGSTDPKTLKILHALNVPGLKIIHQENRGLSSARNTGIRNAKGEYIYFLDADDVIYPECLAKLAGMLQSKSAIAATSAIRISGGPTHGTVWGQPSNPYFILVKNQWSAGIMLCAEASRHYDLTYDESMRSGYEDWELNIRLVETGRGILFSAEPLYEYRVRKKSLLSTTRKLHVEVIDYIRAKHSRHYTIENLLATKQTHAPALQVSCKQEDSIELQDCLTRQTFRDWSLELSGNGADRSRYHLFLANVDALRRLPPEALESTLISLECYEQASYCLIAVRRNCQSLFASRALRDGLEEQQYPVALIARRDGNTKPESVDAILQKCDLAIEFIDQSPSSDKAWDKNLIRILPSKMMADPDGLDSIRKGLSTIGCQLFGDSFRRECIRVYDYIYYRILCSDAAFAFRHMIKSKLGARTEKILSGLLYSVFLTEPPSEEKKQSHDQDFVSSDKVLPLFSVPQESRIHILIATNWLIEGGVEQIIFEICRLLDPSRFRVTIVTTLPSHHAWDGQARKIGAAVYHLADFLRPADMVKGFLHIILNHHVDCMFIMNSEIAYRFARTIKHNTPWLPIIDRVEAPDPGGGYPMISAKVGRQFVDLRTVSHKRLADYMCEKYCLKDPPRVIYIGMNASRIADISRFKRGPLHQACNVSRETPIVLFVGRFVKQKRPETFVRAVARMLEIDPHSTAQFAMVGDGYLLSAVETLIAESGLAGRIRLLGAHPNAVELLADATILLMPSDYEGVALVSYEAMALGVPQIFADVGGQSELITPETGILIKNGRGEEHQYAQACLDLLSDPERRARMAAAGKERIKSHFTAENAVKQYTEIFEQAAASSRRQASQTARLKPPHISPLHDAI